MKAHAGRFLLQSSEPTCQYTYTKQIIMYLTTYIFRSYGTAQM